MRGRNHGRKKGLRPPKWKKRRGLLLTVEVLGRPKIEFFSHALDRLIQRGIKRDDIIEAIRNPTSTGHPTQPGRKRIRKSLVGSGQVIDVVYDEKLPDRIRVITTFTR